MVKIDKGKLLQAQNVSPEVFNHLTSVSGVLEHHQKMIVLSFTEFPFSKFVDVDENGCSNGEKVPSFLIVPAIRFIHDRSFHILGSLFYYDEYKKSKREQFHQDISESIKLYILALQHASLIVVATVAPYSETFNQAINRLCCLTYFRDFAGALNYVVGNRMICHIHEPTDIQNHFAEVFYDCDLEYVLDIGPFRASFDDIKELLKILQEPEPQKLRRDPLYPYEPGVRYYFSPRIHTAMTKCIGAAILPVSAEGTSSFINLFTRLFEDFYGEAEVSKVMQERENLKILRNFVAGIRLHIDESQQVKKEKEPSTLKAVKNLKNISAVLTTNAEKLEYTIKSTESPRGTKRTSLQNSPAIQTKKRAQNEKNISEHGKDSSAKNTTTAKESIQIESNRNIIEMNQRNEQISLELKKVEHSISEKIPYDSPNSKKINRSEDIGDSQSSKEIAKAVAKVDASQISLQPLEIITETHSTLIETHFPFLIDATQSQNQECEKIPQNEMKAEQVLSRIDVESSTSHSMSSEVAYSRHGLLESYMNKKNIGNDQTQMGDIESTKTGAYHSSIGDSSKEMKDFEKMDEPVQKIESEGDSKYVEKSESEDIPSLITDSEPRSDKEESTTTETTRPMNTNSKSIGGNDLEDIPALISDSEPISDEEESNTTATTRPKNEDSKSIEGNDLEDIPALITDSEPTSDKEESTTTETTKLMNEDSKSFGGNDLEDIPALISDSEPMSDEPECETCLTIRPMNEDSKSIEGNELKDIPALIPDLEPTSDKEESTTTGTTKHMNEDSKSIGGNDLEDIPALIPDSERTSDKEESTTTGTTKLMNEDSKSIGGNDLEDIPALISDSEPMADEEEYKTTGTTRSMNEDSKSIEGNELKDISALIPDLEPTSDKEESTTTGTTKLMNDDSKSIGGNDLEDIPALISDSEPIADEEEYKTTGTTRSMNEDSKSIELNDSEDIPALISDSEPLSDEEEYSTSGKSRPMNRDPKSIDKTDSGEERYNTETRISANDDEGLPDLILDEDPISDEEESTSSSREVSCISKMLNIHENFSTVIRPMRVEDYPLESFFPNIKDLENMEKSSDENDLDQLPDLILDSDPIIEEIKGEPRKIDSIKWIDDILETHFRKLEELRISTKFSDDEEDGEYSEDEDMPKLIENLDPITEENEQNTSEVSEEKLGDHNMEEEEYDPTLRTNLPIPTDLPDLIADSDPIIDDAEVDRLRDILDGSLEEVNAFFYKFEVKKCKDDIDIFLIKNDDDTSESVDDTEPDQLQIKATELDEKTPDETNYERIPDSVEDPDSVTVEKESDTTETNLSPPTEIAFTDDTISKSEEDVYSEFLKTVKFVYENKSKNKANTTNPVMVDSREIESKIIEEQQKKLFSNQPSGTDNLIRDEVAIRGAKTCINDFYKDDSRWLKDPRPRIGEETGAVRRQNALPKSEIKKIKKWSQLYRFVNYFFKTLGYLHLALDRKFVYYSKVLENIGNDCKNFVIERKTNVDIFGDDLRALYLNLYRKYLGDDVENKEIHEHLDVAMKYLEIIISGEVTCEEQMTRNDVRREHCKMWCNLWLSNSYGIEQLFKKLRTYDLYEQLSPDIFKTDFVYYTMHSAYMVGCVPELYNWQFDCPAFDLPVSVNNLKPQGSCLLLQ